MEWTPKVGELVTLIKDKEFGRLKPGEVYEVVEWIANSNYPRVIVYLPSYSCNSMCVDIKALRPVTSKTLEELL